MCADDDRAGGGGVNFPSPEFDEAVAAVCDGSLSERQAEELNVLLRTDTAARDEYLWRVELHARLACGHWAPGGGTEFHFGRPRL